jgi:hypothetical protein
VTVAVKRYLRGKVSQGMKSLLLYPSAALVAGVMLDRRSGIEVNARKKA